MSSFWLPCFVTFAMADLLRTDHITCSQLSPRLTHWHGIIGQILCGRCWWLLIVLPKNLWTTLDCILWHIHISWHWLVVILQDVTWVMLAVTPSLCCGTPCDAAVWVLKEGAASLCHFFPTWCYSLGSFYSTFPESNVAKCIQRCWHPQKAFRSKDQKNFEAPSLFLLSLYFLSLFLSLFKWHPRYNARCHKVVPVWLRPSRPG